jgi:hypothetical protein
MTGESCQEAFRRAALRDGLVLSRFTKPWINERGHFGLPSEADSSKAALQQIFSALGGDEDVQRSGRHRQLIGDFIEPVSQLPIEIDEYQHFTSYRWEALRLYPNEVQLGFDRGAYSIMCEQTAPRADSYRKSKAARAFGENGRAKQRAYYDALRDLSVSAMGLPPLIRVPALDKDGAASYLRSRDRIMAAIAKAGRDRSPNA